MIKYKLNCFYMQYKPNDIVELTDQQVIDLSSHIEKVEVIDEKEKDLPKSNTPKKVSDKKNEGSDKQSSEEKIQETPTKKVKNVRKGAKSSTTKKSPSRD